MARCIALQIVTAVAACASSSIANRTVAKADAALRMPAWQPTPVRVDSVTSLEQAIAAGRTPRPTTPS